jgi:hypothetical protein
MDAGKIRPKPPLIRTSFTVLFLAVHAWPQPTLQPYHIDGVGVGFSQMEKRLLTKGTASAVP